MADLTPTETRKGFEIRFGNWHNGDNRKPGRGWYFLCLDCRTVGVGQLLPASAVRQTKKHRCKAKA